MFVLNEDASVHTVYFDVDDTLVDWVENSDPDAEEALVVTDDHGTQLVRPIASHVDALKRHKERGDQIVVWSQSGSAWAEACVKALQLEEYVDVVLTKPTLYYDDFDKEAWGVRVDRIFEPEVEEIDLPEPPDIIG